MIFSRFLRPKYRHPDPKVRREAVADLDPSRPQDKSALHELAFNDDDLNVRLQALQRLDSFALWWKLAQTEKQERIKKQAQQQVEAMLVGEGTALTHNHRLSFIKECGNHSLLERLLRNHWQHGEDDSLSLLVLQKLNKPQLTMHVLFESRNPRLQQRILQDVQELEPLTRIVKRHANAEIVAKARQKLEQLQQQEAKRIQVEKDIRLQLAKLLALRDEQHLPTLETQWQSLETQYQDLAAQLPLLPEHVQQEFCIKHRELSARLEEKKQQLLPTWQAMQAKEAEREALQRQLAQAREVVATIEQQLQQPSLISEQQVAAIAKDIEQARQMIVALPADELGALLHRQLQTAASIVDTLPGLQDAIAKGEALISVLSGFDRPQSKDDLEQGALFWKECRQQWRALREPFLHGWPQAMDEKWKALADQWQAVLQQLQRQVQEDSKRVRHKFRAINDMVDKGKFRPAMALYQKGEAEYAALPQAEREKLQRQYQSVKARVENLKEWQAYIALPRKPQLLTAIQTLAAQPLPALEQAEEVKRLRGQWNSLGKLETTEDEALNLAFDQACEQAFVPVRAHYQEQEQKRAQHLLEREAILSQLESLSGATMAMPDLRKAFNAIQKAWKGAGEVDFQHVASLNQRFRELSQGIRRKLDDHYANNRAHKEDLLRQAQALLALDDPLQAARQAKALQDEWKRHGYAGHQHEARLWQAFRQTNDSIFAKRQQQQARQQEQKQAQKDAIDALLSEGESLLASGQLPDNQWLAATEAQLMAQDAPTKVANPDYAAKRWQRFLSQVHAQQQRNREGERHQQLAALFTILQKAQPDDEGLAHLPAAWRQALSTSKPTQDRLTLTLMMEAIAGVDSPPAEDGLRKEVQLQLMTNKLQEGSMPDLDELLLRWLAQGPVTEADRAMLPRVMSLFLPQDRRQRA